MRLTELLMKNTLNTDKLFSYLDSQVEVLYENLYSHLFQKLLKKIWCSVVDVRFSPSSSSSSCTSSCTSSYIYPSPSLSSSSTFDITTQNINTNQIT
jgi:hypothetical protein